MEKRAGTLCIARRAQRSGGVSRSRRRRVAFDLIGSFDSSSWASVRRDPGDGTIAIRIAMRTPTERLRQRWRRSFGRSFRSAIISSSRHSGVGETTDIGRFECIDLIEVGLRASAGNPSKQDRAGDCARGVRGDGERWRAGACDACEAAAARAEASGIFPIQPRPFGERIDGARFMRRRADRSAAGGREREAVARQSIFFEVIGMKVMGRRRKPVGRLAVFGLRHDRTGACSPTMRSADVARMAGMPGGVRSLVAGVVVSVLAGLSHATSVTGDLSANAGENTFDGRGAPFAGSLSNSTDHSDLESIWNWENYWTPFTFGTPSERSRAASIAEWIDRSDGGTSGEWDSRSSIPQSESDALEWFHYWPRHEDASSIVGASRSGVAAGTGGGVQASADSARFARPPCAAGDGATALGRNARATGARAIALGTDAVATGVDSVALGAGSVAARDNVVSVGQAGRERRIVHVAPGTEGTDAVNRNQLDSALKAAALHADHRFANLQRQIDATARSAYSGIAAVTALSMIPDVDSGRTLAIGIGLGSYKGCHAMALGGTAWLARNLKVRTGIGMGAEGKTIGVGASWQH
ncbi:YadA family autotransporter adhesin [Burkholderia thailandensis]|nr:YadA-like family protein [Burkholderia thailandensis]